MGSEHHENGISARVLEKIKSGRVKMRPKWHFVLLAVLGTTGSALLALTLLYLLSFIIFSARQSGAWFAPSFGFRGWYALLTTLPWLLVALTLVFIVALELLVKHYAFAYRRPLLYSVLGIALLAVSGGFLVSRTPLHPQLMRYAERHPLPVAGPLYRTFGHRAPRDVHRGQITATSSAGFTLRSWRGDTLDVLVTPGTRLPLGSGFTVGDEVVVFGPRQDGQVYAAGVRPLGPLRPPAPWGPPPHRRGLPMMR